MKGFMHCQDNASLTRDRWFYLLLVLNAAYSAAFFMGFKFFWGPDGTNYFLAIFQMFEPGQYGHMSAYYKPVYLLFVKFFQIMTPDGYLGQKIAQHLLGFISPLIVYAGLRHIDRRLAVVVAFLMIVDLNARYYFAVFSTEPLFIPFIALLVYGLAYIIAFPERRAGVIITAIALTGAMFTRSIAIYLFLPLCLFLFLMRMKRAALIILVLIIALQSAANLINRQLGFTEPSKNLLLFNTVLTWRLVDKDNGPYTNRLVEEVAGMYYEEALSREELAYFWDDIQKNGSYSRNVFFTVGFEELNPRLEELLQKATLETLKAKAEEIYDNVKLHVVGFSFFSFVFTDYAWYRDEHIQSPKLSGKEIDAAQRERYDASSESAYGDVVRRINKKPRARYSGNIWSPYFKWRLQDKEGFMYRDGGNMFIINKFDGINWRMDRIINLSMDFLPVFVLVLVWFFYREGVPVDRRIFWLIGVSVLIISYHVLITIPVTGSSERYRAPIDVFYFIILASVYGKVALMTAGKCRAYLQRVWG